MVFATDNISGETKHCAYLFEQDFICNSYHCQYYLDQDKNILLKKSFEQGNIMFSCRLRYTKVFLKIRMHNLFFTATQQFSRFSV